MAWIPWSLVPDFTPDPIDVQIAAALKEKKSKSGDVEILHHSFIGECSVDGLMHISSNDQNKEKGMRKKIALA